MKLSIYEIAFKSKYQAKHTDFKQDEHGPNRSPAKHFLAINKLSKDMYIKAGWFKVVIASLYERVWPFI